MRITEIYLSIQGETQYAGLPCTLVRTTGCDLRCVYCDSAFAFHGGTDMSLDAILAEVRRLAAPLVLLTGGEPMLQRELPELARLLLTQGYKVMIETSGAHALDSLPEDVVRVVDVKTPASGESHRHRWDVLAALRPRDAVKFVVADEGDYNWARDVIRQRELDRSTEVLLSPVHGRLDPQQLVSWMLRTGCRRASTCNCTSTSGTPMRVASRREVAERQSGVRTTEARAVFPWSLGNLFVSQSTRLVLLFR